MRILIAGGGTGGHLFPGIAVAQKLKEQFPDTKILFVGTKRGIEARAVPKAGFDLALLPVLGLRGKNIFAKLKSFMQLPLSFLMALRLVFTFKPTVALSVGGYAAGPAILAAKFLGVPIVVLEQNAFPGLTNRILAKFAKKIITGLPTQHFDAKKTLVLGNPVRSAFLNVRNEPYTPQNPLRILVFGGSLGAEIINKVMLEASETLQQMPVQIVHQTGLQHFDRFPKNKNSEVLAFIDDMPRYFAQADLVICRAGAMTLAELTVCGRPSILIPFAKAVDDHQTVNAKVLVAHDAAILLPEHEFSAATLVSTLNNLLNDKKRLTHMAKQAWQLGKPSAPADIVRVLTEVQSVS